MNNDHGEIVCYCSNVSKSAIVAAIQGGAKTLDDIRAATGACTLGNCKVKSPRKRCCSRDIVAILEEYGKPHSAKH